MAIEISSYYLMHTQDARAKRKKKKTVFKRAPHEKRISFLSTALAFQRIHVDPSLRDGGGDHFGRSEARRTPRYIHLRLNPLIPLSAHDDATHLRLRSFDAILSAPSSFLLRSRYEPFSPNTGIPFKKICNAIPVCRQDPALAGVRIPVGTLSGSLRRYTHASPCT